MRLLIAFVLAGILAGAVLAGEKEEPPRRQILNLETLDIEGRVPDPSTLFIRERNFGSLYELFPLRRKLAEDWLQPIVKERFERATLDLVDRKER